MATLDEATDNFDNLDVGDDDFEYMEHKRNTDRTKIDLFASEAVRFGVSDRATAALWNCLSVRQC